MTDAFAKAALIALSSVYPRALTYPDLLAATHAVRHEFGVAGEVDAAHFQLAWFTLVMAHGVMLTLPDQTAMAATADEPGSHPHAHALARQQATTPGWVVSGARQVAIDLDAAGRALMQWMDGSRDRAALGEAMQVYLAESGISLPPGQLAARIDQQLWQLVRQGVCVAG